MDMPSVPKKRPGKTLSRKNLLSADSCSLSRKKYAVTYFLIVMLNWKSQRGNVFEFSVKRSPEPSLFFWKSSPFLTLKLASAVLTQPDTAEHTRSLPFIFLSSLPWMRAAFSDWQRWYHEGDTSPQAGDPDTSRKGWNTRPEWAGTRRGRRHHVPMRGLGFLPHLFDENKRKCEKSSGEHI